MAAMTVLSASALADVDGNDDFANAEAYTPGTEHNGHLSSTDQVDYYKFSVDPGDNIVIEAETNASEGLSFIVYDASQTAVEHRVIKDIDDVKMFNWHTPTGGAAQTWYMFVGDVNFTIQPDIMYMFNVTLTEELDVENNDVRADAINIQPVLFPGDLMGSDTVDWFRFKAGEGDVINITFNSYASGDPFYLELSREGSVLARIEAADGATEELSYCTGNSTYVDWFYMKVGRGTSESTYNISVFLSFHSDARSGWDAGDYMGGSIDFELGVWEKGLTKDLDEQDWYWFYVTSGSRVEVLFKNPGAERSLTLHWYSGIFDPGENDTGYETITVTSLDDGISTILVMTNADTPSNYWYIQVAEPTPPGENPAYYQFKVLVGDQGDGDSGGDAGATATNATEIEPGTYSGYIGSFDEVDVYKFEMGNGEYVNISFEQIKGDVEFVLENDAGDGINWTSGDDHWWEQTFCTAYETPKDWWYLTIASPGDVRSYNISLFIGIYSDAKSGNDAPGVCADAIVLGGGLNWAHVGYLDVEDWYKFPVSELREVNVHIDWKMAHEFKFQLFDGCDGAIVDSMNGTGTYVLEWLVPAGWTAGDPLYVLVMTWEPGPDGWYTLSFNVSDEEVDVEPPEVDHTPPTEAEEDKDLRINATVVDEDENITVTLYYRMEGETEWKSIVMVNEAGDDYVASIPKDDLSKGTLEYYIEAEDSEGNTEVFQSGTTPINLEVKQKPKDDGPGPGAVMALLSIAVVAALVALGRRRWQ